jgi:hypothetical protein
MRGTLIFVAAVAGLTLASPAYAQDVYIGGRGGGVGVGVGVDVGSPGYRRYRDRDEVYTEGYSRSSERCRTTTIRRSDGSVTKTRRCRD